MARKVIVGPNPLRTNTLAADERLKELSSLLAAGTLRLRLKQEFRLEGLADGHGPPAEPNADEPRNDDRRPS